ncbi:MAG: SPOR domain-containing protein [Balneolaceae bacterium]
MIFLNFIPVHANACNSADKVPTEIFLEMRVENVLAFDLDGYLCDDNLYLPAGEFFSQLNIDHTFSADQAQWEVFFPDDEESIRLDYARLRVQGAERTIKVEQADFLNPEKHRDLFIRKELLEEIFHLQLHFNHSSLLLSLFSEYDLPVIDDYRRQERYRDFRSPKHEFSPDRKYSAPRSLLNGWVVDWSLNSSHSLNRQGFTYGATTGGHVLGGDLYISGRGNASAGIRNESLRGQWRYPIYSTPLIRQVVAGDQVHDNIFSQGVLRYRGVEITNRPNAPRQHFHTFQVFDEIAEGWDVEMYSNNRLMGIARGNDTNEYSFNEPIRYGSNRFSLRHYSPEGFSHEDTYNMTIPRSFLPPGSFEYSLSAGNYLLDEEGFLKGEVNMGVSSFLTVGGGYHASGQSSSGYNQTPYLTTSLQVANRLTLEGSHTFGYISGGSFRYMFKNGRSLSGNARKYYGSSRYNRSDRNFEGSVNTSFPVKFGPLRLSFFTNARNIHYPQYQDFSVNGGFTAGLPYGYLMQLRTVNMFRNFKDGRFTHTRSDISLSASKRVLRKILLRPGIDYNHYTGKVSGYKLDVSSRISRNADFSFSLNRDQLIGQYRFQFSFRYNFPFGRYRSQIRTVNAQNPSLNQTASGSFVVDTKRGDFYTFERNQTNKASLRLEPFLADLNGGESVKEAANQLTATLYINGIKQATYLENDIIKNLIPYQEYHVRIEAENLDNPLWQLESEQFQIRVIPHVMNRLPIPIIAVGEVSGRIQLTEDSRNIPVNGLSVKIQEEDGSFTKTVNTYSSGQFYYVGLKPGDYKATLDPDQLSARNLNFVQEEVFFTIEPTQNGDIVDQLNLTVTRVIEQKLETIFVIQIGAFRDKENAAALAKMVESDDSFSVEIIYDPEDKLFRSRLGYFKSEEEALHQLQNLNRTYNSLFDDAFIIKHEL